MLTFLIFIIVIGVLVLVHEFGHFVTAKRSGMKVEEFGIGFPPKLFSWKKGETIYSVNMIPFGGFVKIMGEEGRDRDNPRSFSAKPIPVRLRVVVAGVIMNFLFATALLMFGNFVGLRVSISDSDLSGVKNKQIQIIQVTQGSPAQEADIRALDQIIGFKLADGSLKPVASLKEIQDFSAQSAGQSITMQIKRGAETLNKQLLPRSNPPEGQGPLGISLALTGEVSYSWYESIWRGIRDSALLFINTVYGYGLLIGTLLFKGRLMADISGPIGIATMTGQAAQISFNYLLQFVAVISMNLAVLNIIPFPALDGGRALLLIIEKIRRKPMGKTVEMAINTAGFLALIGLMIFITAKDVLRFF